MVLDLYFINIFYNYRKLIVRSGSRRIHNTQYIITFTFVWYMWEESRENDVECRMQKDKKEKDEDKSVEI